MNRTTQVDRNSVYSICRHTSSSCIVEIHAALQRHLAAKRNYSVWLLAGSMSPRWAPASWTARRLASSP